MQTVKGKE